MQGLVCVAERTAEPGRILFQIPPRVVPSSIPEDIFCQMFLPSQAELRNRRLEVVLDRCRWEGGVDGTSKTTKSAGGTDLKHLRFASYPRDQLLPQEEEDYLKAEVRRRILGETGRSPSQIGMAGSVGGGASFGEDPFGIVGAGGGPRGSGGVGPPPPKGGSREIHQLSGGGAINAAFAAAVPMMMSPTGHQSRGTPSDQFGTGVMSPPGGSFGFVSGGSSGGRPPPGIIHGGAGASMNMAIGSMPKRSGPVLPPGVVIPGVNAPLPGAGGGGGGSSSEGFAGPPAAFGAPYNQNSGAATVAKFTCLNIVLLYRSGWSLHIPIDTEALWQISQAISRLFYTHPSVFLTPTGASKVERVSAGGGATDSADFANARAFCLRAFEVLRNFPAAGLEVFAPSGAATRTSMERPLSIDFAEYLGQVAADDSFYESAQHTGAAPSAQHTGGAMTTASAQQPFRPPFLHSTGAAAGVATDSSTSVMKNVASNATLLSSETSGGGTIGGGGGAGIPSNSFDGCVLRDFYVTHDQFDHLCISPKMRTVFREKFGLDLMSVLCCVSCSDAELWTELTVRIEKSRFSVVDV